MAMTTLVGPLAAPNAWASGSRSNSDGGGVGLAWGRSSSVLAYVAYGRFLPARKETPLGFCPSSTRATPVAATLFLNGVMPPEKPNTPPIGATIAASVDRTERTGPITSTSLDWYTARNRTTEPSTRSS